MYKRAESPLIEAACWAHARRKFYDVHQATDSPLALEAMHRIGELCGIEDPSVVSRRTCGGPCGVESDALRAWLHEALAKVSKKSELAGAIRYTLSRWTALRRYRDDGCLEIDNNAAERALRRGAGPEGLPLCSLVGSAKLNGLDPQAYLRHVRERIADHPVNAIADLLLWNVAAEQADAEYKQAA